MIASLEGILAEVHEKQVVLTVAGVGYRVFASRETRGALPRVGEAVKLRTVLVVREDVMDLYGFATEEERELFELLITVSGVGPKAAMNVLGAGGVRALQEGIADGNEDLLTKVSGVGRKTAAKIIMELKDKLRDRVGSSRLTRAGDGDVREALVALGYGEREIQETIRAIPADITKIEERIRAALQMLGK